MDREQVRENIRKNASFDRAYVLMNILAAVIASYGLLANSAAVVIGAMIVAMLIGPITGISLSLVEGDFRLTRSSLISLVGGMALVYLTAMIIGVVHADIPITGEMMARTSPNFLDLMVAIAGGAAGAYAAVSARLSVSLVGVAIATALVPPLCASSMLLARGEYALALGAFLLTFVNIVAIHVAAAVVLWLAGFRGATRRGSSPFKAFALRSSASLLLLAALAGFMVYNLHQTVSDQLFHSKAEEALRQGIEKWPGSYLAEVRYADDEGATIVRAVVRAPKAPTAAQVAALEDELPQPSGSTPLQLRVRYVPVQVFTSEGEVQFVSPEDLADSDQ